MLILAKVPGSLRKQTLIGIQSIYFCTKPPSQLKNLSPEILAKREKFLDFERDWESKVDHSQLSEQEKQIVKLHNEAVQDFKWTYIDPATGNKVNTRFRKYLLEKCCGNACRHCIFNHENVTGDLLGSKRFNSAFWVPVETNCETMSEYKFSPEDVKKWMAAAQHLVTQAGELIKENLGKAPNLEDKDYNVSEGHASAVLTETDLAVEKFIRDGIKAQFSDHEFIGEEGEGGGQIEKFTNNPTWIIDPIDGTMNFIHGNPLVCTSVGLAVNRKIIGGIVNCPVINHMYTAVKGQGAFLNGDKKLKTSGIKKIKDAMVLLEMPTGANLKKKEVALTNMTLFMDQAHAVRCPGPAATDIAWIGSGSADAFFHMGIHIWDMAAGVLIITEAGGAVMHTDGSEFNLMGRQIVAAASEELAKEIVGQIMIYKVDPEFNEHCPM